MPKRNVLVTGATSVIGRQLVEQLYEDVGHVGHVMAVARDPRRPYYFEAYESGRFSYLSVNILKERELTNLMLSERFRASGIDTVVHLAYMDRSSHPAAERHELNVGGTRALIERCAGTEAIRRFVFLSSFSVYRLRPQNSVLLDEGSELNFEAGADPWIKDRVDADMICRSMMDHPRLATVVLRPSGIIGRNVPSQLNQYLSSRVCPQVIGFDPMVNLVHSLDVMRALRCAVHRGARGVYNVVGRETAPLGTFVRLAGRRPLPLPEATLRTFNRMQRRLSLTDYDVRVQPERLKYACVPDGARAARELGYAPRHHVRF